MRVVALLAVALSSGALAGCGDDCVVVTPARSLGLLGLVDEAKAGEIGLRARQIRTGQATGKSFAIAAGDPLLVRVALPPKHCEGDLTLLVGQVVGPADPPGALVVSLAEGDAATGAKVGADGALPASDDALTTDPFVEETGKRYGPSVTRHSVTFRVPAGVDAVTFFRSSAEVRDVAVESASFISAPPQ